MNFVEEAKKFIKRAADAGNPDVVKENLKMADWCLGQAIEEQGGATGAESNGKAARPS